jgi:myo-inositol 2-dehydrogenase / D-chiro-inositol 1-dehydrogenase
MNDRVTRRTDGEPSRRSFLKLSAAAAAGGALAGSLAIGRSAHAAGSDVLKIGLIGCGGRGSGAAGDALRADPNLKLTALGDTFSDRVKSSLQNLSMQFGDKVAVADDHCFVGFDAYQKVIDSGVDVIILATPPHFRPVHLKAVVAAGKHAFVEKPVAVDALGVRSVQETCEEAKKKGLSIVSGLCYRYEPAKRETIKRIHDGAIGDIVAINVNYDTNPLKFFVRQSQWSDMEWQVRNWQYFNWLSGDHIVEQHIHSLDKAAWVMHDEPPKEALGLGGRQVRAAVEDCNNFDHHAVVYEYASGVRLFAYCRQQAGCHIDVTDHIMGTKGRAELMKHVIEGKTKWRYRDEMPSMYQEEHDAFFASIRSAQPINNGDYMTRSTMMAILGRMATYTGQLITWDQAINSTEKLGPDKYVWGTLPVTPVARPGITQFS